MITNNEEGTITVEEVLLLFTTQRLINDLEEIIYPRNGRVSNLTALLRKEAFLTKLIEISFSLRRINDFFNIQKAIPTIAIENPVIYIFIFQKYTHLVAHLDVADKKDQLINGFLSWPFVMNFLLQQVDLLNSLWLEKEVAFDFVVLNTYDEFRLLANIAPIYIKKCLNRKENVFNLAPNCRQLNYFSELFPEYKDEFINTIITKFLYEWLPTEQHLIEFITMFPEYTAETFMKILDDHKINDYENVFLHDNIIFKFTIWANGFLKRYNCFDSLFAFLQRSKISPDCIHASEITALFAVTYFNIFLARAYPNLEKALVSSYLIKNQILFQSHYSMMKAFDNKIDNNYFNHILINKKSYRLVAELIKHIRSSFFVKANMACSREISARIINNQEIFDQAIISVANLEALVKCQPKAKQEILERVLTNKNLLVKILKNIKEFKYFITTYPAYKDQLMSQIINNEKLFKQIFKQENLYHYNVKEFINAEINDYYPVLVALNKIYYQSSIEVIVYAIKESDYLVIDKMSVILDKHKFYRNDEWKILGTIKMIVTHSLNIYTDEKLILSLQNLLASITRILVPSLQDLTFRFFYNAKCISQIPQLILESIKDDSSPSFCLKSRVF